MNSPNPWTKKMDIDGGSIKKSFEEPNFSGTKMACQVWSVSWDCSRSLSLALKLLDCREISKKENCDFEVTFTLLNY